MPRETKFYQLLFAWILALTLVSTSYGLLISAFNIKNFGEQKRNNADIMGTIVKIINRYDVILIQEVMDKTEDSSETIAALKKHGLKGFTHVSSVALGKKGKKNSHTKEHYLFLIRENAYLTVEDSFQFRNSKVPFLRPPFSIKLSSERSGTKELKEFVLSAIHVKPDEKVTKKEISQLKKVHEELYRKWKTNNIIIMGDMNAGGRYISQEDLDKLPIAKLPFLWLPKDTNTMISCYLHDENTEQAKGRYGRSIDSFLELIKNYHRIVEKRNNAKKCPYDRFIITGAALKKNLNLRTAGIFKFNEAYKLTEEEAKAVSDHYPIELQLRG